MPLHQHSMLIPLHQVMSTPPLTSRLTKPMIQPRPPTFNKDLHHLSMIPSLLYNCPIRVMILARTFLSTHHLNPPMIRLLRITRFIRGMLTHPPLMDIHPTLMRLINTMKSHTAAKLVFPMNNITSLNSHATATSRPILFWEVNRRSLLLGHRWIPQLSHGAILMDLRRRCL